MSKVMRSGGFNMWPQVLLNARPLDLRISVRTFNDGRKMICKGLGGATATVFRI